MRMKDLKPGDRVGYRSYRAAEVAEVMVVRVGHYVSGGPWREDSICEPGYRMPANGVLIRNVGPRGLGDAFAVPSGRLVPLDLARAQDAARKAQREAQFDAEEKERMQNVVAAEALLAELRRLGVLPPAAPQRYVGPSPREVVLRGKAAEALAQILSRVRPLAFPGEPR